MIKNILNQNKIYLQVIAAASRGARSFIKKALTPGHNVTGLCLTKIFLKNIVDENYNIMKDINGFCHTSIAKNKALAKILISKDSL